MLSNKFVPGIGNSQGSIMLIGEAPGKNEDIQGKPFVGKAGQRLFELLNLAKIPISDIYITNLVKHRPANNRDPKKIEIQQFAPMLIKEIKQIKPKFIIPLGKFATQFFIPKAEISTIHGTVILNAKYKAIIFPLFHPAYSLYNPTIKTVILEDLLIFKKLYEQK